MMNLKSFMAGVRAYRDLNISLAIACCAYALFFWNPAPVRLIESTLLDWHYQLRGSLAVSDSSIALVMVDNQSLKEIGRWPWPRQTIADIGEKILGPLQARTLALDMIFSEPTVNTTKQIVSWMHQQQIPVPLQLIQQQDADDSDLRLANFLQNNKHTVQGFFYEPGKALSQTSLNETVQNLDPCFFSTVNTGPEEEIEISTAAKLTINIPALLPPPGGCGFLNFAPDIDGAIRFSPVLIDYHGFYLPSLALAALRNWLGMPELSVGISLNSVDINMADHQWEVNPNGWAWPVFQGPTETIPTYSAVDVLHGNIGANALKDKLVFLGVSAAGIDDIRPTPVDSIMPGTEIQAQIAYALLHDQLLARPNILVISEFTLILLLTLIYGLLFQRVIERSHGLISIALGFSFLGLSHWLFLQGIWMHVVIPLLQLSITFSVLFILYYSASLQRRKHLRDIFSTYIDPSVVDEALANESGEVMLGGQDREISVMFMDVAGFTALSEKLSPQEVVHCINQFYDAATPIVQRYDGCIDRLMGDGMICLFGTPLLRQNHAINACQVALEMEEALNVIRPTFKAHQHNLSVRIGINTGVMTVGNMGSSKRVHYTFMGDSGNVAARLESLNKQYGSLHMIGESTWSMVHDQFACREIDQVVLVGKTEPMRIFELLANKDQQLAFQPLLDAYAIALSLYRKGHFSQASLAFKYVASTYSDHVSKHMQQRCELLLQQPPAQWQGIWQLQQK